MLVCGVCTLKQRKRTKTSQVAGLTEDFLMGTGVYPKFPVLLWRHKVQMENHGTFPLFSHKNSGMLSPKSPFSHQKVIHTANKKERDEKVTPRISSSTEFPSPEDSCFTVKTTVGEPRHHRCFFSPTTFSSWKNPIEFFVR